jgi:hypothetical protein
LVAVHEHAAFTRISRQKYSMRSCFRPSACAANSSPVQGECRSARISNGTPASRAAAVISSRTPTRWVRRRSASPASSPR